MAKQKTNSHLGFSTGSLLAKLSLLAAILSGITLFWTYKPKIATWSEQFGLTAVPVDISGTGSMAPTFPVGKGSTPEEREAETVATLSMWRYPGGFSWNNYSVGQHELEYGDLVFVRDTRPGNIVGINGLIKRVIGLPGDTIELRDGYVWRNTQQIVEPYTLQGRSTFGGTTVRECTPTTIPNDSIFVLGDNRKQSDDSRFRLGFVPLFNVQRYYPWTKQSNEFGDLWRTDAEQDGELAGQPTFDPDTFLQAVNDFRTAKGLDPLARQSTLNRLAQERARLWVQNTPPATESAALLTFARNNGYGNPLIAELPISGFFTSQELSTALEEISQWQEILLRPDYQEIGLDVYVSSGECPKQSIVIFLGGYVPAQYDPTMVQSWETALQRLNEVKPGWVSLESPSAHLNADQKKNLTELLGIIDTRIERISNVLRTMQRREWLTEEQQAWLEEDATLAERQLQLSQSLNNR